MAKKTRRPGQEAQAADRRAVRGLRRARLIAEGRFEEYRGPLSRRIPNAKRVASATACDTRPGRDD